MCHGLNTQQWTQSAHLLSLILVQVVLLLLVCQVPPHPSDDFPDLPQLQVRVGRLHLVPYLARAEARDKKEAHRRPPQRIWN